MAEPTPISTRDLHFANLVRELEGDAKYRPLLHAMVADKFPDASRGEFPDVEVRKAVAPVLKEIKDERAKFDKERADARAADEYKAWRESLVTAGIAAKDLDAVETIAREKGIADPKALKLYYDSTQTAAQPTTRGWRPQIPGHKNAGGEWFNSDGQGGPGIMGDRQTWTLNRANQVWDEVTAAAR